MEALQRQKAFKASCVMQAGISGTYTAGGIMNLAPIVSGTIASTSTLTVTPASMVGIRTGMTLTGTTAGLTAGRTVISVGDTTFTISAAATSTAAQTLTFVATDLPKFDLSAYVKPGENVLINTFGIVSSFGGSTIRLAPTVFLYNTSAVQTAVSNNTAFTPTYSVQSNNCEARIVVTSAASSFTQVGASAVETCMSELVRIATVDTNSCLHMVAMDTNTYLWSSTETVKFVVKGYVL